MSARGTRHAATLSKRLLCTTFPDIVNPRLSGSFSHRNAIVPR